MDNARRVPEPFQEWMMACRRVLKSQIGVLHAFFCFAGEIHAKEPGESEVLPPCAPLVVQAGLVCSDQAAAAANELPELVALRVREGDEVRQDEGLELINVRRVEHAVVNHFEGDTRLDERLVP